MLALKPVCYWSKTLTLYYNGYHTTNKEVLAVIWAKLMLRRYVEVTHFTIKIDLPALRCVLDFKKHLGCLAQCRLRLIMFGIEVTYKTQLLHRAWDDSPRLRPTIVDDANNDNKVPVYCIKDRKDLEANY